MSRDSYVVNITAIIIVIVIIVIVIISGLIGEGHGQVQVPDAHKLITTIIIATTR